MEDIRKFNYNNFNYNNFSIMLCPCKSGLPQREQPPRRTSDDWFHPDEFPFRLEWIRRAIGGWRRDVITKITTKWVEGVLV